MSVRLRELNYRASTDGLQPTAWNSRSVQSQQTNANPPNLLPLGAQPLGAAFLPHRGLGDSETSPQDPAKAFMASFNQQGIRGDLDRDAVTVTGSVDSPTVDVESDPASWVDTLQFLADLDNVNGGAEEAWAVADRRDELFLTEEMAWMLDCAREPHHDNEVRHLAFLTRLLGDHTDDPSDDMSDDTSDAIDQDEKSDLLRRINRRHQRVAEIHEIDRLGRGEPARNPILAHYLQVAHVFLLSQIAALNGQEIPRLPVDGDHVEDMDGALSDSLNDEELDVQADDV